MSRHYLRGRMFSYALTRDLGEPTALDYWADRAYREHPRLTAAAVLAGFVILGVLCAWVLAGWAL